jgi:hypothetical protein
MTGYFIFFGIIAAFVMTIVALDAIGQRPQRRKAGKSRP